MLAKLIVIIEVFTVLFLEKLVNSATPISITITQGAIASVPECQTTPVTVTVITVAFSCTPTATSFTPSISRTVTPTGPALACFDITSVTTCGVAQTCASTCSVTLKITPGGGCVLNYEELSYPTSAYSVQFLVSASPAGFAGSNVIMFSVPITDCNEAPTFTSVAYTTKLPEYPYSASTYSGLIGTIDITDPDVYNNVYGSITVSVNSVTNNATATSCLTTPPFYFNVTSGANHIITALYFDTSQCPTPSQCLAYFDYISPVPVYEIVMRATDGGNLFAMATYTVTISQVYDAPIFTNLPSSAAVGEIQGGPFYMYTFEATSANNFNVTFYIMSVNPPSGTNYFSLGTSCSIAVPTNTSCKDLILSPSVIPDTLNYYSCPQYNLTIWGTVTTPIGTQMSVISWFLVNVTLVNRVPVPSINSSSLTIGEDQKTASCLWTIAASDRESNPILYNMLSVTPSSSAGNNFFMNDSRICFNDNTKMDPCCGGAPLGYPWCGWIFNALTQPQYIMNIKIFDAYSSLTPYTFTFTLNIQTRNKPPTITGLTNATMSLWECSATGTANTLSATDPELDKLTFSIGLPQPSNALMFYMSTVLAQQPNAATPATALLKYATPPPLNSSITPLYLNLTVSDSMWTVSTSVNVNVKYCDTPPYFLNLAAITSLNENQTGTAPFFTVSSYDKESDTPYYYFKLSNGSLSPTTNYFSIGYTSGIITYSLGSMPVFDAYATPSYTLSVVLTNSPLNGPTGLPVSISSQVAVQIIPINKAPTMTMPSPSTGATVTIYENVTFTQTLYTLNATDREGDPLFYKIMSMGPTYNSAFRIPYGLNYFEFNVQYANSTPMLDYILGTKVYYIGIQVFDLFTTPTSTASLTVSVLRCDKPPIWTSLPATVNVREDVTLAADLVTIGARDNNPGGYTLTYTYVSLTPTNGSSKFYFNTATKAFGYNSNPNFNYQTQNAYQAVFVVNNGVLTATSYVNIVIVQRSSPTTTGSSYSNTVTVYEDQTYSSLIWDLRATDNSSTTLTYGLISVAPATNAFVVTTDGLVKIQANPGFNYQTCPRYVLKFSVVNSNVPPRTTTFTLTVNIGDVAQMPTYANLPNSMTINEGVPGAAVIYTTMCLDKDGRTLSYTGSILPPSMQGQFSVNANTGAVSTLSTTQLVYRSTPSIYITITCANTGYTTTATLTINVQNTQYWSVTQPTTTTTTTQPTTTTGECSSCLTSTQIGAIAGSIGGALVLAGIAYGLAKVVQGKAAKDGTLQNVRQVTPPPYYQP